MKAVGLLGQVCRAGVTQVNVAGEAAENEAVKTRKGSHDDVPSDGGDLENWLHDLVGGERSARRLREQLGPADEHSCAVCSADESYFGLGGHLHGRLSA
jgi:hypothetical protein